MFQKVLIANRGEPAVRISRACRALDITPVVVCVDVDRGARYIQKPYSPGEPYYLGADPKLYTNYEAILDAARKTGADAIALGWGFLAENSDFVKMCENEGIKTISPTSEAISLLGDKISAKKIAREANLPVIPGFDIGVTDAFKEKYYAINYHGDEIDIFDASNDVGYPLIIKGSAGGGGIGMKVAYNDQELCSLITQSINASKKSFNNGTVFVEKYLEDPRHVEVQVMGDTYGNIVHYGERECSIQRRHQKLIEECPSPLRLENIDVIEQMCSHATELAKKVNYTSAGTVEFLYKNGEIYFLEMNTRLQVEHPITEVVRNVDLAKEQIRVAAGEELEYVPIDIREMPKIWAIECRLNAETPTDFTPNTGQLTTYRSSGGPGVRVDSGVNTGALITPHFDSMISKLIASGKNREEARIRMCDALDEYVILGVTTNIPFHKAVMRNPGFIKGDLSTNFIENYNIASAVEKLLASGNGNGKTETMPSQIGGNGDTPDRRQVEAVVGSILYQYHLTSGKVPNQFTIEVTKAQKIK